MADIQRSSMQILVNPEIKAKAEPILASIGLSFSDVFNLTLHQICLKQRIPFELSAVQVTENGYPVAFEAELLTESERLSADIANGTTRLYRNTAELFAEWDKEDAHEREI